LTGSGFGADGTAPTGGAPAVQLAAMAAIAATIEMVVRRFTG
jgi:hypothetical protein